MGGFSWFSNIYKIRKFTTLTSFLESITWGIHEKKINGATIGETELKAKSPAISENLSTKIEEKENTLIAE